MITWKIVEFMILPVQKKGHTSLYVLNIFKILI